MMYDDRDYDFVRNNPGDEFIHMDDLPTAKTQDYLEGIKEALYKTGDIEALEHCLEELCGLYDVEFKDEQSIFDIRRSALRTIIDSHYKKNQILSDHIDEQRKMIDKLLGRDCDHD